MRVTLLLLNVVETVPVRVWAAAYVAQLSLVAAVAPVVAQPPRIPPIKAGAAVLILVRNTWEEPGSVEPKVLPMKLTSAPVPAVRVRLPMVRARTLLVVAAGAVAVIVLKPVAAVTPAPVVPRLTLVEV